MANNIIQAPPGQDSQFGAILNGAGGNIDNYTVDQKAPFWYQPTINPVNWNKVFPYTLYIMERKMDSNGNTTYVEAGKGRFVLPFPPESISISMPFASTVSATLGGIVEEHNGIPFRLITFSGTLGVLPLRGSAPRKATNTIVDSILGGVTANVNRAQASAQALVANFASNSDQVKSNIVTATDISTGTTGKTSGYYQMELLKSFLENYSNLKRTTAGAKYQLAVAIFKQQAIYLVKPENFVADQNASSPLEYRYSLQFKAWKRIDPSAFPISDYNFVPVVKSPNALQRSLNALQDARAIIQNSVAAINGVVGDVNTNLLEPLRQTVMFAKDHLGVALALADMGSQIIKDAQTAALLVLSTQASVNGFSTAFLSRFQNVTPSTLKTLNNMVQLSYQMQQVTAQNSVVDYKSIFAVHPGNEPFNNPQNFYSIWNGFNISELNLAPSTSRAILQQREKIRKLSRLDFENFRDSIAKVQADFSDAVGAGNQTFNTTFMRDTPISTKTPTENDFNIIFALNRCTLEIARLAATYQTNLFNVPSINFVAGAASRSGIAFNIPRSKYSVPFPYGMTMEQLSTQYLGTPDRWMEIATLNGLKAPYVDEEGFDIVLITDGSGNNVYITSAENLFLGQTVWLSSTSTQRTVRQITKITKISNSYVQLTLNGDPDLARFSTLAGAVLHAFLPDTVNSMQTIFIPSANDPQDDDYQTKEIPGLSFYNNYLLAGGVDLLLTQTNDLAITPDGDCRLAVGLPNIIQQARIALSVVRGTLNRHPEFGLPQIVGQNTADVDVKQVALGVQSVFAGNSTFSGVSNIFVNKVGPNLSISMSVNVRGINQNIPITFSLPVT